MIVCGWCHAETPAGPCAACGRDAELPWTQRGQQPPAVEAWQQMRRRRRLEQVRRDLGPEATVERIAEALGVSDRTVRRWMSGE